MRSMLQRGHLPGVADITSGCIGHTYALDGAGTRSMLQRGHLPGEADMTSGCIGHMYAAAAGLACSPVAGAG